MLGLGASIALAIGLGEAAVVGTLVLPIFAWAAISFLSIQFLPTNASAPRVARWGPYASVFLAAWHASPPETPLQGGALAVAGLGWASAVYLGVALAWNGRAVGWRPALALALMGSLLALLSGGRGSAGGFIDWLMGTLDLDRAAAEMVAVAARKGVHFAFYGAMAWAALAYASHIGAKWRSGAAFALTWVLAHATFDEWRQSEAVGRTGSAADVALDMAGATAALLLAGRTRRRAESDP